MGHIIRALTLCFVNLFSFQKTHHGILLLAARNASLRADFDATRRAPDRKIVLQVDPVSGQG